MTTFIPAKREAIPLLLGVAGGTGSGKTYSAMRLATGLSGGARFAVIDTENGRAKHYAETFEFDVADLTAPYRPERYTEVIDAADAAGYPVIVVDSMSHEWAGDGGCLDWKDELSGGDDKKAGAAWAKVKPAHKRMVSRLLQAKAHVILCYRAEPKIDIVRENGQIVFKPKTSITGLDGWMPITEKMMPFELMASFLLMADAPGVPRPIKLEAQHKPFVPLDQPLSEETGKRLAEWARGDKTAPPVDQELLDLNARLVGLAAELGNTAALAQIEAKTQGGDKAWLKKAITAAEKKLEEAAVA